MRYTRLRLTTQPSREARYESAVSVANARRCNVFYPCPKSRTSVLTDLYLTDFRLTTSTRHARRSPILKVARRKGIATRRRIALPFFCDHLLQHRLVEAEIATSRLSFEFSSRSCRSSRISAVPMHQISSSRRKTSLRKPELTGNFGDRRASFGLAQAWRSARRRSGFLQANPFEGGIRRKILVYIGPRNRFTVTNGHARFRMVVHESWGRRVSARTRDVPRRKLDYGKPLDLQAVSA